MSFRRAWILVPTVTRSVAVILAALISAPVVGDDAATSAVTVASDPQVSEVQDIVVLAGSRPLLIRLQITTGGAPFRQPWSGFVNRVFRELDRDSDGRLTPDEAAKCPPLRALAAGASGDGLVLKQLATEHGGALSREDFVGWQAERGARAFVARSAAGQAGSNRALFELLDADHDSQIADAEFDSADETLRRRDFNDDEIIGEAELRGARSGDDQLLARLTSGAAGTLRDASLLFVVEGSNAPEALAAAVLARYDTDGDGSLRLPGASPGEIAWPESLASSLDADKDGLLPIAELAGFSTRKPDAELRFAFGTGRWQAGLGDRPRGADSTAPRITRRSNGTYKVELKDTLLEFRPDNRDPLRATDGLLDFTTLDADKNKYLGLSEVEAQVGAASFSAMDVDGDEKVTRKEFDPFVRRPIESAAARLQFSVADQGHQFFEKLDENGDSRLTSRELRRARDLLAEADRNSDGRLGEDELPRNLRFDLARGDQPLGPRAGAAMDDGTPLTSNEEGPLWFTRMDANADGDLSRREFLGPADAFTKLDSDGDGLIDAVEAAAAK